MGEIDTPTNQHGGIRTLHMNWFSACLWYDLDGDIREPTKLWENQMLLIDCSH